MSTNLYTNDLTGYGNFGEDFPIDAHFDELDPSTAAMQAWIQAGHFEGELRISDAPFIFPKQQFKVFSDGVKVILESRPTDSWPSISIVMSWVEGENPRVENFLLQPSDRSIKAQVLFTRAQYTLDSTGTCILASGTNANNQPVGMAFSLNRLPDEKAKRLLYQAKVARKLSFLQNILGLDGSVPEKLENDDLEKIEMLFRGITEGEFVTRGKDITVLVRATEAKLSNPPFSGIGSFTHCINPDEPIAGIGPVYIKLKKAIVANHAHLNLLREGKDSLVRFEILDNQITFRYEKYTNSEISRQNIERLNDFYSRLKLAEPSELADTLLESLASDVSSDEATEIAVGWQEYRGLPDRYCPQDPVFDALQSSWRVPIYLVYPNGKRGSVGELLIDVKSGSVIEQPSVEEMRQRGVALAEKLLRVG